jgi:hypothetical protein
MEVLLRESNSRSSIRTSSSEADKLLKKGIWAYFFLLIFEGALRKWFLPGLANPLLVIRDPIAIWLLYLSWKRGLFPSSIYLNGIVLIGFISLYTAIWAGHGNVVVALYGARIFLIHFPLIFVIGRVFNREDILKMAKVTLYLSIPMAMLITMQFYSPQSAWVNRGLAGDLAGAGFSSNGDFFRPPGTFSFTNGTTLFFAWLAPFVFYYLFNHKRLNIWLLVCATGALLISIPFSISRGLFFQVSLTLVFAVIASLRKPENFNKILVGLIGGLIALVVLSQTRFFTTATGAFTDRFTNANAAEGGLVKGVIGDRFLGGLIGALENSSKQPFLGLGTGMGTNVGSQLLTGERTFLIDEGEWGRLIGELGPLMGIIAILLRVGFVIKLGLGCYRRLIVGDLLPWLLLSFGFVPLIQGQWAQPTSLGFSVMIGGLVLASLRNVETEYQLPLSINQTANHDN